MAYNSSYTVWIRLGTLQRRSWKCCYLQHQQPKMNSDSWGRFFIILFFSFFLSLFNFKAIGRSPHIDFKTIGVTRHNQTLATACGPSDFGMTILFMFRTCYGFIGARWISTYMDFVDVGVNLVFIIFNLY